MCACTCTKAEGALSTRTSFCRYCGQRGPCICGERSHIILHILGEESLHSAFTSFYIYCEQRGPCICGEVVRSWCKEPLALNDLFVVHFTEILHTLIPCQGFDKLPLTLLVSKGCVLPMVHQSWPARPQYNVLICSYGKRAVRGQAILLQQAAQPPALRCLRRDDAVLELATVCADLDAMQATLADSAVYVRCGGAEFVAQSVGVA